ncbi:hypothetical protein [Streptacidiphilus sp. EB103A]|uniref:hypothetical protein n=1 Tax=Streptacidiphilus sp. EB103A TaxID=3156275 RepID=UPI003510FCDF
MTNSLTPVPDPDAPRPLALVDDTLAGALTQQGPGGIRALGLLRDAGRLLEDPGFEQAVEIADSSLRNAMDTLLSLHNANGEAKGMRGAAEDLATAVGKALPKALLKDGAPPATAPVTITAEHASNLVAARHALLAQTNRPGGYHRERAALIARLLHGQELGAAQLAAADRWGSGFSSSSATLHGHQANRSDVVDRYHDVLELARQVFVPLPGRAARILELAALTRPAQADANELAGWHDARATTYFFLSRPSWAWLALLDDVLLLPDPQSGAAPWPALPYLDHLTATAAPAVTAWLADHFQAILDARPDAVDGLLRLAARPDVDLAEPMAAQVGAWIRKNAPAVPGWTQKLAADWACTVPAERRTSTWLQTVTALLELAVRGDHRVRAAQLEEADLEDLVRERVQETLPQEAAARLLRAMVRTTELADAPVETKYLRGSLARLLLQDVTAHVAGMDPQLAPQMARIVFNQDLTGTRVQDTAPFLGPVIARAVLDLAFKDAGQGVPLVERTVALERIGSADSALRDRLVAAHLLECRQAEGPTNPDWWDRATALLPSVLVEHPGPECANLASTVLAECPPEQLPALHSVLSQTLGPVPDADALKLGTQQLSAAGRPPEAWLVVWDGSPWLPAEVLQPWQDVLDALRAVKPAGPPDPRVGLEFTPYRIHDVATRVSLSDLLLASSSEGAVTAAGAIARAEDRGLPYAVALRRLLGIDWSAWATDPGAVAAALDDPELAAAYLEAVADHVAQGEMLPSDAAAASALTAALSAARALPEATPGARMADRALVALAAAITRSGADVGTSHEAVEVRLLTLAERLTAPATEAATEAARVAAQDTRRTAGRALNVLLVRRLADPALQVEGDKVWDVLDALLTNTDEETARAIASLLPQLLAARPQWVTAHAADLLSLRPGSPAALWLRLGPTDPDLLALLDRTELLDALRTTLDDAVTHVADLLLHDSQRLGPLAPLLEELADGPGGPAACSRLLARLAGLVCDAPEAVCCSRRVAAEAVWSTAVGAGLPAGSLAGAGAFARCAGWPQSSWLELTGSSAGSVLKWPHDVAARAAKGPDVPAAVELLAKLVEHPGSDPWHDTEVRRYARLVLEADRPADGAPDLPRAVERLRIALVNSGDIDAHTLGR